MQGAAHRLPAHGQKQHAPQELADFLDPQVGMAPLEVDDLRLHHRGHLRPLTAPTCRLRLQARFPLGAVHPHPLGQRTAAHAHFADYLLDGEAFLQT